MPRHPDRTHLRLRPQRRYAKAAADGFWATDITPVTRPDGTVVDSDDSPRPGTTVEALSTLPPAFRPDGRVTAGSACPLNDGASCASSPPTIPPRLTTRTRVQAHVADMVAFYG